MLFKISNLIVFIIFLLIIHSQKLAYFYCEKYYNLVNTVHTKLRSIFFGKYQGKDCIWDWFLIVFQNGGYFKWFPILPYNGQMCSWIKLKSNIYVDVDVSNIRIDFIFENSSLERLRSVTYLHVLFLRG